MDKRSAKYYKNKMEQEGYRNVEISPTYDWRYDIHGISWTDEKGFKKEAWEKTDLPKETL